MKKKTRAKRLTKHLANMGRHGDTMLAHVNPREAALLRALGGSGTRNPESGLPEFFDSDMGGSESAGFGGGFDTGSEQGPTQDGSPLGGGVDTGSEQGPGLDGTPLGGLGDLQGPTQEGPPLGGQLGDLQGPGLDGTPLGGGLIGDPQGPNLDGSPLGKGGGLGELPGSGLGGWLERNLLDEINPNTQRGLMNIVTAMAPTGFTLGARGMYSLAEALGDYVGKPLNDALGGNAKPMDLDFGNASRFGGDPFAGIDMGPSESQRDVLNAMMGGIPAAAPVKTSASSGARVNAGGVPDEIAGFIGPGMTDLQQRALISTYGTQGVNSAFKADPVKRYYARLLNNAMFDEKSAPVAEPYTLPIEHLYWQGVLGRPVEDPGKSSQVLDAIRAYL